MSKLYNDQQYNSAQYGSAGFDYALTIAENITLSDSVTKISTKLLQDIIDFSSRNKYNTQVYNGNQYNQNYTVDTLATMVNKFLLDNELLVETIDFEVGKGLTEEVRMAIWLIDNKNPAQGHWGDQ